MLSTNEQNKIQETTSTLQVFTTGYTGEMLLQMFVNCEQSIAFSQWTCSLSY